MNERQADDETRRLNAELGAAGISDAYFHASEVKPGDWEVVRVDVKRENFFRYLVKDVLNPFDWR